MDFDTLALIAGGLQVLAGLISLIAYLPQIAQIVKSRSSTNIAVSSWILWQVGATCSLFYAIVQYMQTGTGLALIFSCAVAFVLIGLTILLTFRYREDP